jgi:hypothetical protein
MKQTMLLLFAIPVLSIVFMGIYQICDEMFKKHFVLERRKAETANQASTDAKRRRYTDSVPPGTLRNPETGTSATAPQASTPPIRVV